MLSLQASAPAFALTTEAFGGTFLRNSSRQHRKLCPTASRRQWTTRACAREVDPLAASPLGAPKVLCVGEALLDVVGGIAVPGGAPANLAVGLARLGTASALIGAVGDDADGTLLETALKESSVNCDGLQRVAQPTRRVLVDLNEEGEREFVGFSGENSAFADATGVDVGAVNGVLFYASQFVAVGTLGLAFPGSRASLAQTLEVAQACQLRVFVDVNWRPVFWKGQPSMRAAQDVILAFLRKHGEFVKISVDEVSFLLGREIGDSALADPSLVLTELGGAVKGVIVTDGPKGASWVFTGGMDPVSGRINAFSQPNVADTVGAGDAFLAGFLAEMFEQGGAMKLMDSATVKRCAQFGAATAAICCSGAGGLEPLPTRAEVESFLDKQLIS